MYFQIYDVKYWGLLAAFFLVFLSETSSSQTVNDILNIQVNGVDYSLNQHLYIYRTNKKLSPGFILGSLKKKDFKTLSQDQSFSERLHVAKHYWLLVKVKNTTGQDNTFYYQFNSQVIDLVEGYQQNENGRLISLGTSGTNIPFQARPYNYCDIVYPVQLKAGTTTTILFVINNDDGDTIHFLPQLRSANTFKAEEERFYLVAGLITGLMLTVFMLNVFFGLFLKDKLHLLYAVYILIALYEIYSMRGLDIQYLYPNYPILSGYLQNLSPSLLGILMTYIMQWFLNQKKSNSRIKILVDVGLWIIIALIPVNLFIFFFLGDNRFLTGLYEMVLAVVLLIQCLLFILSAVEKVIQKFAPAWFYLAAVLIFLIGLIEFILMVLFGDNQELLFKRFPNDIEIGIVLETFVIFLGIVFRYNSYKTEKENLMNELNRHQQELIKKIVGAEEEERKRLARDLHDDLGATLSTLSLHLGSLEIKHQEQSVLEQYQNYSLSLSNKAFNDMRAIAHDLLPKDFMENGLFNTINERIEELNQNSPINFVLITEGEDEHLPEVYSVTIYRIIKELLANINKHSLARQAALQILIEQDRIQIMTEDDGIGFNQQKKVKGIGLKNIQGRVAFLKGTIHIDSNENGTQMIIEIPL
ncbi:sensor histidine kinase [Pedobacter nutrimenti]|uniref:histidine kinase n=1 Tax=Pedobacter nutrimenti TaxID=1241337 RepID=A0A318UDC5_9SPHI|nr:7TM diverse intracellular signaling domain-containing protein [Pedobacter nutrimenti]PYF74083.1 signal transduction histidine kinase [Pedobacter nutrimenti]